MSLTGGVTISRSVGFLIYKMGVRPLSFRSSKYGKEVSGPGRRYSPRPGLWGSVPRAPALAESGRSRAYSPRQLQQQAREADAPRAARPQHGRDLRQLERRAHAQRAPVAEPQQRLHGARWAGTRGVPPARPPGEGSSSALGRRVHRPGPSAFPGPRLRGRPVEVRPSASPPPISALGPAQGLPLPLFTPAPAGPDSSLGSPPPWTRSAGAGGGEARLLGPCCRSAPHIAPPAPPRVLSLRPRARLVPFACC